MSPSFRSRMRKSHNALILSRAAMRKEVMGLWKLWVEEHPNSYTVHEVSQILAKPWVQLQSDYSLRPKRIQDHD